jgi:hypothetical protein
MPALPVPSFSHKIFVGDNLELRRPDGSTQSTIVTGFESTARRS